MNRHRYECCFWVLIIILIAFVIRPVDAKCDEMDMMTRAMYFEATPLNFHDMVAIGTVIKERLHISYRGADNICDVIESDSQISSLPKMSYKHV